MSEPTSLARPGLAGLIALGAFAVLSAIASIAFAWVTSDWQRQTNLFYTQSNGSFDENDPKYVAVQHLQLVSSQFSNLIAPLALAALAATFVILGVLALRWARRHPLRP